MSCHHFKLGDGTTGILTLADESEPFLHCGKWFVVNKLWGPIRTNKIGDPLQNQPNGRELQAAYEHYLRTTKAAP